MRACLLSRDREEWAAIIILLYVSGSVVVSVRGRRWKPGGRLGLLALWGASSRGRGSETSNWTAAVWMEKCWGSKLSLFHWVELLYCTIGLKTRSGGGRPWASLWLYYRANIIPKLRFTQRFIPHLSGSGSSYLQHLWSIYDLCVRN